MKKLTASIFTVLLATVGAANAEIASKAYVDKQTGELTDLGTTAKGNLVAAINELNTKAGNTSVADQIAAAVNPVKTTADNALPAATAESDYLKKADAATTYQTLNNLTTELTASSTDAQYPSAKAVYDATKDLATADNVYTKTAADAKFAGKATTLEGYGITDAYTTTQADGKFQTVANIKTDLANPDDTHYPSTKAVSTALDTAAGNVTTLAGRVTTAESDIDTLEGKMTTAEGNITTLQSGKQDKLTATSVTTTGDGNAVTAVAASDGSVSVTLGKSFIEQTAAITTNGKYALTANITDGAVSGYGWELIERAGN